MIFRNVEVVLFCYTTYKLYLLCHHLSILGPWSDKHGRKFPLLVGVFGNLASFLVYIIAFYFHDIPAEFMLISAFISGATGGSSNLVATCGGYICDITDEKSRTLRMTLCFSSARLGWFLGNYIAGRIYVHFGFGTLFVTSAVALVLTLLYGLFFVKNVIPKTQEESAKLEKDNPLSSDEDGKNATACNCSKPKVKVKVSKPETQTLRPRKKFFDTFNYKNIVQCIVVVVKKREGYTRSKIICLIIANVAPIIAWSGKFLMCR